RGSEDPGHAPGLPHVVGGAGAGRLDVARQTQSPRRARPSQRRRRARPARADRGRRRGAFGPGMIAATPTDGAALNPLREGLPVSDRIDEPCSIVFFGASGDLFKRMLLPAVYSMRCNGTLPADFALVGFARTPFDDDSFREYCRAQLDVFMPPDCKPEDALWDDFSQRISYVAADFKDSQDFVKLKALLARNDERFGTAGNHLFYLATPPSV